MWGRWDSNSLHGCFARAVQVVQATIAPLATQLKQADHVLQDEHIAR